MDKRLFIVGLLISLLAFFVIQNSKLKNNSNVIKEFYINEELKTVTSSLTKVILRNLDNWSNSLVINSGLNDGVTEGDYVICNEALIGIVTEANYNTSVVELITNKENKLSAKILGNEILYGLIHEYCDGYLIMKGLKKANILVGSHVVTTGISYIYPPELYIGKVSKVLYDNFDLTPTVYIETPVDFNNILYVSVLKR